MKINGVIGRAECVSLGTVFCNEYKSYLFIDLYRMQICALEYSWEAVKCIQSEQRLTRFFSRQIETWQDKQASAKISSLNDTAKRIELKHTCENRRSVRRNPGCYVEISAAKFWWPYYSHIAPEYPSNNASQHRGELTYTIEGSYRAPKWAALIMSLFYFTRIFSQGARAGRKYRSRKMDQLSYTPFHNNVFRGIGIDKRDTPLYLSEPFSIVVPWPSCDINTFRDKGARKCVEWRDAS